MKLAKRLATMLMCVCLVVPCLTMMVQAATPGKILLGEATAKAGEEVTVSLKAQVDAGIGNRTITISYDSSILQFVSASSTTKVSDGELQYKSEQGINSLYNETELDKLTFKALKDGTATISVKTADVKSSFEITWTYFDGKVTVSGGTPVTSTPSTDSETTETPDDQTAEEQTDDEVVVNEDAEVVISNTTTITLISDVSNVVLSERYAETFGHLCKRIIPPYTVLVILNHKTCIMFRSLFYSSYCTGARAPKAPLCKGSCQRPLTEGLTTPPSKIKDFAHLPLHRGGFGALHIL